MSHLKTKDLNEKWKTCATKWNKKNPSMKKNPSIENVLKLTSPKDPRSRAIHKQQQDYIMKLATKFNEITGSVRPLIPDFYDCGTMARAIFMYLIWMHRCGQNKGLNAGLNTGLNASFNRGFNAGQDVNRDPDTLLYPYEEKMLHSDYKPPKNKRHGTMQKLGEAIHILEEMNDGVMIFSLRYWYPDALLNELDNYELNLDNGPTRILKKSEEKQFGHVWIIEKKDDQYFIYQSSLNNFMTQDYFCAKGAMLNKQTENNHQDQKGKGGPEFVASLYPLLQAKTWTPELEKMFMDRFYYSPNIPEGLNLRPEFFYGYIEY